VDFTCRLLTLARVLKCGRVKGWSSNSFLKRGRAMSTQTGRVHKVHALGRFGGVRSWPAAGGPAAREMLSRMVLASICIAPFLVLLLALAAMMR
jgi:hypothetical protein